jgi:hypothetical protein
MELNMTTKPISASFDSANPKNLIIYVSPNR